MIGRAKTTELCKIYVEGDVPFIIFYLVANGRPAKTDGVTTKTDQPACVQ